ncbi:MAG: YdcF family protein [Deltaproteobacteria bacterium]|nr:YdcF family protein [Deltaproteobacteria bacterium]
MIALFVAGLLLYLFSGSLLRGLGRFVVVDETPVPSDAVIVLNTGVEYYPRLVEAADLYRKGLVKRVIINGNRKTDSLRELENRGFKRCCPWYENSLRILSLFGVPRDKVTCISAEDVYDTVSEAKVVGREVLGRGLHSVLITTSKYHTKRARYIWKKMYDGRLSIRTVAAKTDPYDPSGWWRDGRQIRWVMAEYGAWIYYWWKNLGTV